ncbi:MAG: HAMP domain-containing histidine kinase [Hyphomicrobiaceae bacterium]|nr:HAMP domain-containing histidine kinase [Hyphomicrobiaceae bacterium]
MTSSPETLSGRSSGAGIDGSPLGASRSVPEDEVTPSAAAASQLARLAHELRTPLSAITAAAELMRDEQFGPIGDPRYRGYAGDIHENARHALAVIERMLGRGVSEGTDASGVPVASSPDSVPELVFTEVDIADLAARVASSLRALVDTADLKMHLDLDPGVPRVVADAVTVRQILLNLVTNSVRATPPGGLITISVRRDALGPLVVMVADTGCGIDAAALEQIRSGRRCDIPTSAQGEGIGLPLVMRFAAANGASVSIDSRPGSGTLVSIVFPPSRLVI